MKIAYIANLRFPSERAYGHQVGRVVSAMHELGHHVTVIAPDRKNPITEDFWSYHAVPKQVMLAKLPAFDGIASPWTPGVIGLWSHNWSFIRRLSQFLRDEKFDLLYTRSPALLRSLLASGIPVMIELHSLPRFFRGSFAKLLARCRRVVCLTEPMRNELLYWGVPEHLLCVEPDGIDPKPFSPLPDREASRKKWKLQNEDLVIGYAGSLHTMGLSKGADLIVEAVKILQPKYPTIRGLIAGGPSAVAEKLRSDAGPSVILGQIAHADVPSVYAASDILVYPAPKSSHPYFMRDTSPLKLLEYMVTGLPVACADIPPVHDICTVETVTFFEPGNAQSLAGAIESILNHPVRAKAAATHANDRIRHYLWTARMERILSAA